MQISVSFITGLMLGFEGYNDTEEGYTYFVVDLFMVRIMFIKEVK